jgi:transcriptional regulator with XRE-family HTH domain
MSAVGTILTEQCDEKGWSLRELARRADVPAATVHKIAAGSGVPRPDTLQSLADALGMGSRVLLEAAATDAGYITTNIEDKNMNLLVAGISQIDESQRAQVTALVEAMLRK